jgi:hypothetical protein
LEFGLLAAGDHPAEIEHNNEPLAHLADTANIVRIDAGHEVWRILDLLDGIRKTSDTESTTMPTLLLPI